MDYNKNSIHFCVQLFHHARAVKKVHITRMKADILSQLCVTLPLLLYFLARVSASSRCTFFPVTAFFLSQPFSKPMKSFISFHHPYSIDVLPYSTIFYDVLPYSTKFYHILPYFNFCPFNVK